MLGCRQACTGSAVTHRVDTENIVRVHVKAAGKYAQGLWSHTHTHIHTHRVDTENIVRVHVRLQASMHRVCGHTHTGLI